MLFNKKIEPRCVYCARGKRLNDDYISCMRFGVVSAGYHCKKFVYDPMKRIPPARKQINTNFEPSAFSITDNDTAETDSHNKPNPGRMDINMNNGVPKSKK